MHRRNRTIDLFGPDGVAEEPFTRRIPRTARARTFLTHTTAHHSGYLGGSEFYNQFRATYGRNPEPYAIFGYEAMALALHALARGGNTRAGAVDAFFATRDQQTFVGTFSIDENGDTTLPEFGGYGVSRGGRLVFIKTIVAQPAP